MVLPAPLWRGSPFPGLRAFTPDDAPIFFGRGRETDELIKKVSESRFVAVVGASGSGKSSLVAAGLLPRLAANAISGDGVGSKDWRVVSFKPGEAGGNPFEALYDGLMQAFPALRPQPLEAARLKREFVTELTHNPADIVDTCQAALAEEPDWAEVVLFIDQFEETFTQVRDETLRHAFVALVETVARAERMRIVLTLRADFYYRCVEHEALARLLRNGNFPLAAPGERALEEMIKRPVERAGVRWEDEDLPERILQDTGQEPGALPLMAYTLDELYKVCCQDRGGTLSMGAYKDLGGVQGAIGTRAENVFEAQEEDAQQVLVRIFRELVEVDMRGTFTRKRAPLAYVTDTTAKARLVNALTEARLLVQSRGEEDQPMVEVAHEALLQHWGRLKDWLEEAREDLIILKNVREDAAAWIERGQRPDDDGFYRGTVLEDKLTWVERNDLSWDQRAYQDVLAFLEASQHHERRRRLRTGVLSIGFVTAIMVFLVALVYIRSMENEGLQREVDAFEIRQQRVATLVVGDVGLVPFGEGVSDRDVITTATRIAELNSWTPTIEPDEKDVEMVFVPAGCFWMGSITGNSDEEPVHEVCFDEPFWIDRFEVTNSAYQQFVEAGGYDDEKYWTIEGWKWKQARGLTGPLDYGYDDPQQPRLGVSWYEANAYVIWRGCRLPSEAMWEYAARGPDNLVYPWGNEFVYDNAVYYYNNADEPADVGSKLGGISWVGAYDLSGNVWEWVADWYDADYYSTVADGAVDPPGPEEGSFRVLRGGSWSSFPNDLRGSSRTFDFPGDFPGDGQAPIDRSFRCARFD